MKEADVGLLFLITVIVGAGLMFVMWKLSNDKEAYFVNEGVLFDGQITVTFSKEISKQLQTEWKKSSGLEYSACVVGSQTFSLNEYRFDTIQFNLTSMNNVQDGHENYVALSPCTSIAVVHSHPQESCQTVLGVSDIESAKTMFRSGVDLYLIQCGQNKVEVYSRDNLYEGIIVELET